MGELKEEQKQKIKEIISELAVVPVEEVLDDSTLRDDLGLDSIDVVEVIMAIEKEFNIQIPDEDYHNDFTVKQLFEMLEYRIK